MRHRTEQTTDPSDAGDPPDADGRAQAGEGGDESDDLLSNPEPWEPVETRLVAWSFVAASVALVLFGALVNIYLL